MALLTPQGFAHSLYPHMDNLPHKEQTLFREEICGAGFANTAAGMFATSTAQQTPPQRFPCACSVRSTDNTVALMAMLLDAQPKVGTQ